MTLAVAYLFETAVRIDRPANWSEVRQWLDRLGLSGPKAKRDLRFRLDEGGIRTPREADVVARAAAEYRDLLNASEPPRNEAVTTQVVTGKQANARRRYGPLRLTDDTDKN